jgi:F0F1-type ATP synthase assembly protein I
MDAVAGLLLDYVAATAPWVMLFAALSAKESQIGRRLERP